MNMVLTKQELIAALQHEVRILLHLAGKVDKSKLDYRPTPKQRSTLELLQYMAIMGPTQIALIKADVALGVQLNIRSTPTFFINQRKIEGALPLEEFRDAIKQALRDAGR